MNREDVIQLALDAGFERNSLGWTFTYGKLDYHLQRFANAIEQRTLERAAHGEPVSNGWQLRMVYFQDGEPIMHKAVDSPCSAPPCQKQ